MNYIKQMMEDKGIEFDERFYYVDGEGDKYTMKTDKYYNLLCLDKNGEWNYEKDRFFINLLKGSATIEKFKHKPKTLVEQLKEQGHGWIINTYLEIDKIGEFNISWNDLIGSGVVYLTESDAEKEIYRRKLEFEMQEYARVHNDCEIDWKDNQQEKYFIYYEFEDCRIDWNYESYMKSSADFNVYFTSQQIIRMAVEKFGDRIKKYYEWESE